MKLLIIGETFLPWWADFFAEGAEKNGITHKFIDVNKLIITARDNKPTLVSHEKDFDEADIIVCLGEKLETVYYFLCLIYPNKRILNGKSILLHPNFSNKFIQSILIQKFADITPASTFTIDVTNLNNDKIEYPLITKISNSENSYSGYGVDLINNFDELSKIYVHNPKHEIKIEEYIDLEETHDYRTIIIGGEVLGTSKRIPDDGFKSNASKNQVKYEQESKYLAQLVELFREIDLEYGAADYVIKNGKLIIFEINRFPFFGKFQEAVGIHVGEKVVKYLIDTLNS